MHSSPAFFPGEFYCGDRFLVCGRSGANHVCNCSADHTDVGQALASPPVWNHKKANASTGIEDAVMLTREQIAFVRRA